MSSASQRKLGEPFARGAWGIWRAGWGDEPRNRQESEPSTAFSCRSPVGSARPGASRPAQATHSKYGRLVPKRADSFQKRPTLETADRLWQFGLCVVTRVE